MLTACSVNTGNPDGPTEIYYAGKLGDGADTTLQVVTTIFPEYDWVREIVGMGQNGAGMSAAEYVDVSMLLDNGADLHSYQPSAADIAKISSCDIFIYVGGESDFWVEDALKNAKNKDMVVINLLDVLGEQAKKEEVVEGMEDEEKDKDDHGDEDGHHHEGGEIEYDEHVWLSLKDARVFCSEIADVLADKDPGHAEIYKANVDAYNNRLSQIDKEYQTAVDSAAVKTVLFGDRFPFRYMFDDYGLKYYAAFVGCSAETEASFDTIIFLSQKIDELKLPAICTIEKSDQKLANTVKDNTKTKNQEILTMNSLQSITSSEVTAGVSYVNAMGENLEVLKKALGE
ncbi:MAG: zinc ABC transporter substrate-binding protein [Eubacterium sp.]|nr:zinc ABC transporter substrate-binding protein [Eubacterium sp.]